MDLPGGTTCMAERLRDALGLRGGIVCAVGAGGKKSLLLALASEHRESDGRLALANSARTSTPPAALFGVRIEADDEAIDRQLAASAAPRLAYSGPEFKPGRVEGLAPSRIAELHQRHGFALSLVKADGARMRWIKAPAEDEPAVVPGCALLLPVLSLRALGCPLDERVAHRPERISALTGLAAGETITPAHLVELLVHPQGCLRGAGAARVVPVLNMIDCVDAPVARALARAALVATDRFDEVLLSDLRKPGMPRWERVARAAAG